MRKALLGAALLASLSLAACGEDVGNQNQAGSGHGETGGAGAASGRTDNQETAPASETMPR